MLPDRLKDSRGASLVEVMIALVVLLLVMMGLLQAALLSIDSNVRNILRDEGVNEANKRTAELSNLAFDNPVLNDTGGVFMAEANVTKNLRNFNVAFTRMVRVQNLDANTKSIQVMVGWNYKNERPLLAPTGTEFQHSVTIVRRRS